MKNAHPEKSKDFSLVLGGPLYQLYRRTFLLSPPFNLCKRRILFITLLTWLPLLFLTLLHGDLIQGVAIPFIFDLDTHIRFLVCLALLIGAEVIIHKKTQFIIQQFIDRDIIAKDQLHQFNRILNSAMTLRNSYLIEILLIIGVYIGGYCFWTTRATLSAATWYGIQINGIIHFTPAGYWYTIISLPIFQFILVRWYFRLLIWFRVLWQIARMPLQLNALHPDKTGGLGFLAYSIIAFTPLLLAHTILLSGIIANRSWHSGVTIGDFKLEIIAIFVFLCLMVLTPLVFFIPALAKEKVLGLYKYGIVASHYVKAFDLKWLTRSSSKSENILGTSDIQSLADLSNSFQIVREMRVFPASIKALIQLLILIALPFIPLVISMVPMEKIIERLIGLAI